MIAPEAPRNKGRRGPQSFGGFSAFLDFDQQSGDSATDVEVPKPSNGFASETDDQIYSEAFGKTGDEIHPNAFKQGQDGSITRRSDGSPQKIGGFTERLNQLNIVTKVDAFFDDNMDSDNEFSLYGSKSVPNELMNLSFQPPSKSSPDKSIIKASRFGDPNIYPDGERPMSEFWSECEGKYEAARKWNKEMKHFDLQPIPDNQKAVKFSDTMKVSL